jgi:hypothetical protein
MKLLRCPRATVNVQSNRTESDSVNDVTNVKLPKIQKPGRDSKVMVAYKKHSSSLGGYSNNSVLIKHPTNKKGLKSNNRLQLRSTYL